MKSIIQEASTIAKAIEQGWKKADQPQEFSVKILEEPTWNFLGLTTRSAKVALFFDQRKETPSHSKQHSSNSGEAFKGHKAHKQKDTALSQQKEALPKTDIKSNTQVATKASVEEAPQKSGSPSEKPVEAPKKNIQQRKPEGWTEPLVASAQEWLSETLSLMNASHITFKIEPQNLYLRITLVTPVLADLDKEKHLLASLSTVLLAALKRKFRKPLRGHKIVLTHAEESPR